MRGGNLKLETGNLVTLGRVRDFILRLSALLLAGYYFFVLYAGLFVVPSLGAMPRNKCYEYPWVFASIIGVMMAIFSLAGSLYYLNMFLRNRRWWGSLVVILVLVGITLVWMFFCYWLEPSPPTYQPHGTVILD
jgi:hypothetical protein